MSAYFESLNRRSVSSSAAGKPAPTATPPAPPATRAVRPVERPAVQPVIAPSGAALTTHYTALRERLLASANGRPLRVIVLAGCEGGEGTGQIVRDFGETLATSGLKVMVLDAAGRENAAAGNDVAQLVAREGTAPATPVGKGHLTLVAGPTGTVDKENFYRSAEFASWLDRQRGFYDYVLIEAPPLVRFSDGALLGRLCDGVVIVVEAGATHRDALARGRELLERSDVKVIGAVLNRVRQELPAVLRPFFPDE